MKTHYSSCLAIAAIISIAAGCSGSKTLATSSWQPQPVVIDGNMDDWQQPLRYANADTKVNYSFTNDGEKLYLCLLTVDRRAQSKIMLGGLQIKIQPSGAAKDEKVATVIYPIGGSITFPKPEKGQEAARPDMNQILGQASSLQVSGFPFSQVQTELPLLNKFGVNVAMNFTKDDRLIYEASIPVKDLDLKDKDINITIIIKGMPKDKNYYKATNQTGSGSGMANGMGAGGLGSGMRGYGSGGGMGGYGGGYGGGGQSAPRMNSAYTAMFADQRIHLKTRLANQ